MRNAPHRRQRIKRQKFLRHFTPLRVEQLEERALLTITPELVIDLNLTPVGVQAIGSIVEVGNVA